jgi:glycosyltransferase involved in cell wall biosynthesis
MNKPLWSVTIPTYNSAEFLAETLTSVLAEDLGAEQMEILVIDNCSTDATEAIVRQVGQGRVQFIRNEQNLGLFGNFDRCIARAQGQLLHLLHSDDLVKPGFYKAFTARFQAHPEVYLVSCNAELIDEKGNHLGRTGAIRSLREPSNDISELMYKNPFRTPGVVVRKEAYAVLGGFDQRFTQTSDWDMWVRVVKNFKGLHIDQDLCQYREHLNNASSKVHLTGENILDTERLFKKFEAQGYPISKKKYLKTLRRYTQGQLAYFYAQGNQEAIGHLRTLHKKYSSPLERFLFALRHSVKRGFR